MKRQIVRKYFCSSIPEIALAGLFICLWTVSAAYLNINFGPMKAGIYLAFAILTGLIFKPIMAYVVAIIADNLQLLLGGNVWSWLFALLPIIIIFTTRISKLILKIKNEKVWFFVVIIAVSVVISSMLIILLINQNFVKSDQGKILDFTKSATKILVWSFFAITGLIFLSLIICYCLTLKNSENRKKIKKVLNITIIVTFVYIIASWVIGPLATIVWLNQIGGTSGNHGSWTSYYWKMYNPYVVIRILKTPVSLPLHIIIVYGIFNVYDLIKTKHSNTWN